MSASSSATSSCPYCAAVLPAGASATQCPRCLMAQIIEPTQAGESSPPLPPLSPQELAPHFPQLDILECLGRGGMGVVYKARQKSLNRLVALKLLSPERADDPAFAMRFEKEAHALAALNHPHIVAVHDFGSAGGFYYLLMEYVDGVNLRQLLQTKRLTPKEALSIVPPVCDALQCAHERGIVHRDIKPENLLIDKAGIVKIADFGVAKIIGEDASQETVAALGTPDYAAPEQYHGSADHRADIYSLGVVLYEMLTGERPKQKIEAPSKRVQVDIRIDEIVLRALEKQPELRFATAAELRSELLPIVNPPEFVDCSRYTADPANWYWQVVYCCKEDPRIAVPERIAGLGWTLNLGNPWAVPFFGGLCLAVWALFEYLKQARLYQEYGTWVFLTVLLLIVLLFQRLSRPIRRLTPEQSGGRSRVNTSGALVFLAGLALLLGTSLLNEMVDDMGLTTAARHHREVRTRLAAEISKTKAAVAAKWDELNEAKRANDSRRIESVAGERTQLQALAHQAEQRLNEASALKQITERRRELAFRFFACLLMAAGTLLFVWPVKRSFVAAACVAAVGAPCVHLTYPGGAHWLAAVFGLAVGWGWFFHYGRHSTPKPTESLVRNVLQMLFGIAASALSVVIGSVCVEEASDFRTLAWGVVALAAALVPLVVTWMLNIFSRGSAVRAG